MYLSLAAIFAAQTKGIDMPFGEQIVMMLTLMLTSKGVAAVPRASLVILSGALTQFGLPLEAIALIIGADHIMDSMSYSLASSYKLITCIIYLLTQTHSQ